MWFIFPLIPAILTGIGSVVGLCGGGTIFLTILAADQIHRRRGHKLGEGVCTPRDGGWNGVSVSLESASDLGQYLGALANLFPELMGKYLNHTFELTKSEGEQIRSMLMAVEELVYRRRCLSKKYNELVGILEEDDCHVLSDILEEIDSTHKLTELAIKPVILFLDSIPTSRTKKEER